MPSNVRIFAVAAAMCGLLLAGCSSDVALDTDATASATPDATTSPAAGDTDDEVEWLMVQNADAGTLTPTDGGGYELVLTGVGEDMTMFSDTPERFVETTPSAQMPFILAQADDGLNAALQIGGVSPTTIAMTLEDAAFDDTGSTVTYSVSLITEDRSGAESVLADIPAGDFSPVSLFIDSWKVHHASHVKVGPFQEGSTCQGTDDTAVAIAFQCWTVSVPDHHESAKITFRNTGEKRGYINPCFDDFNKHYLNPGEEVTLTYKDKKCLTLGWDKKDASRDGKVLEWTIVSIEDVD